jgi:hypothetical protein
MSKVAINSFNAGELSPYLYARSDFDKYRSGCLTMENFVPLPYGGATRRPAIEYIGDSKQDDKIRLIPFTARVDATYVLELGDQYMRFWKDGVLQQTGAGTPEDPFVPVEVGTPWTDTEFPDVKFAQSIDVMWLVHPDHAPQRLSRFSDTSWTMTDEQFDYPPLRDENNTDITMSPSATTGTITLTSSTDFFNEGHVGSFMSFSVPRINDNASISDLFTDNAISDPLYVSNANWDFSTSNSWSGKVVLQRSTDGAESWEDYIVVGDTTGVPAGTGQRNFTISSDSPEPTNTWIRVLYIDDIGDFNFQLKTEDPWNTLVKITAYTDAQNVTAEVIDSFQDTASDYDAWTVSGTPTGTAGKYDVGDKVEVSESFTHVDAAGSSRVQS